MEVILYYDKQGKKQWVIAEKGNKVIQSLVAMGYNREDFLTLDVTGQINETVEETFGY